MKNSSQESKLLDLVGFDRTSSYLFPRRKTRLCNKYINFTDSALQNH